MANDIPSSETSELDEWVKEVEQAAGPSRALRCERDSDPSPESTVAGFMEVCKQVVNSI